MAVNNQEQLKVMMVGYCDWNHPHSLNPKKVRYLMKGMSEDEVMEVLLPLKQAGVNRSKKVHHIHSPLCDMISKGDTDIIKIIFPCLVSSNVVKLVESCPFMPLHMANAVYWRHRETVLAILSFITPKQQLNVLSNWEGSEFTKNEDKASTRGYRESLKLLRLIKEKAENAIICRKAVELEKKANLKLQKTVTKQSKKIYRLEEKYDSMELKYSELTQELEVLRDCVSRQQTETEETKLWRENTGRALTRKDDEIRRLTDMLEKHGDRLKIVTSNVKDLNEGVFPLSNTGNRGQPTDGQTSSDDEL